MYMRIVTGPLSELEELELRHDRLLELVKLELVSPTLAEQIQKAVGQIAEQIKNIKAMRQRRAA